MEPETKKKILIAGGIIAGLFGGYKLLTMKKSTSQNTTQSASMGMTPAMYYSGGIASGSSDASSGYVVSGGNSSSDLTGLLASIMLASMNNANSSDNNTSENVQNNSDNSDYYSALKDIASVNATGTNNYSVSQLIASMAENASNSGQVLSGITLQHDANGNITGLAAQTSDSVANTNKLNDLAKTYGWDATNFLTANGVNIPALKAWETANGGQTDQQLRDYAVAHNLDPNKIVSDNAWLKSYLGQ